MNPFLIISGLVALVLANTALWWMWGRHKAADLRVATASRDYCRDLAALREEAMLAAAAEVASLRERNQMLTDLIAPERRPS